MDRRDLLLSTDAQVPSSPASDIEIPVGYPAKRVSHCCVAEQHIRLAYPPQLQGSDSFPIPAIIGLQYCMPFAVHFVVQKHHGDFTIVDGNGRHLFTMEGKGTALRDRRILRDSTGPVAATLRRKILSMHETWEVFAGEKLSKTGLSFMMKKPHILQGRLMYDIFVAYRIGFETPDFIVKGSFQEREFSIFYNNKLVAEASKTYSVVSLAVGKNPYGVNIRPNVDSAFIASVILILDQIHSEKYVPQNALAKRHGPELLVVHKKTDYIITAILLSPNLSPDIQIIGLPKSMIIQSPSCTTDNGRFLSLKYQGRY